MFLLAMLGNTTTFVFYQFISENNLYNLRFLYSCSVAVFIQAPAHDLPVPAYRCSVL